MQFSIKSDKISIISGREELSLPLRCCRMCLLRSQSAAPTVGSGKEEGFSGKEEGVPVLHRQLHLALLFVPP